MSEPSLIRVSLRHHSPEEIYHYLLKKFGKLGMKVKAKQAIIGFQSKQVFNIVKEVKVVNILGKRLQLIPITPQEENNPCQIEEQIIQHVEQGNVNKPGVFFIHFKTSNPVEEVINQCKVSMMQFIQNEFAQILQQAQNKVVQISSKIPEEEPRRRQIQSLKIAICNKLNRFKGKYENDIISLNSSITNFSVKGEKKVIDVEPTFAIDNEVPHSQIQINNVSLVPFRNFTNIEDYPCKRLCALNRDEFIVTTKHPKCLNSKVKIFDVNSNECKAVFETDQGAYGICRSDKLILVGTMENSIMSINLQADDIVPECTKLPGFNHQKAFFEMKRVSKKGEEAQFAILGQDKSLRIVDVCKEQVIPGVYTTSIEERKKIQFQLEAVGLEIHNDSAILVGMRDKVTRFEDFRVTSTYEAKGIIHKIKKFNNNVYALACDSFVKLLDVRARSIVQTFVSVKKQIRPLQVIAPHTIIYSSGKQIGVLDDRRSKFILEKNDTVHNGIIYDILRVGDKIISCDNLGKIIAWRVGATSNQ